MSQYIATGAVFGQTGVLQQAQARLAKAGITVSKGGTAMVGSSQPGFFSQYKWWLLGFGLAAVGIIIYKRRRRKARGGKR